MDHRSARWLRPFLITPGAFICLSQEQLEACVAAEEGTRPPVEEVATLSEHLSRADRFWQDCARGHMSPNMVIDRGRGQVVLPGRRVPLLDATGPPGLG
eukprot:13473268-Alexandrium_andersonii.AAC.1